MGCGGSKEKDQRNEQPVNTVDEPPHSDTSSNTSKATPTEKENKSTGPKNFRMNGKKKSKGPKKVKPIDWEELYSRLPCERVPEQKEKRGELFAQFDTESNGHVTLPECRAGCRNVLKLQDFSNKIDEVVEAAFNAAKGADDECRDDGKGSIEKCEFRLLMLYLRQYFEAWEAFQQIDDDNSGSVSIIEFQKSMPKLEEWGVIVEDPVKQFAELDSDKGGTLTFDEFADWMLRQRLAKETPGE